MKYQCLFLCVSGFTLSVVDLANATSTNWITYGELKKFASKLRADGKMMDRLECYRDPATGKKILKVRYRNNHFNKQWKWAVESSGTNLNRKYVSQGFRQNSLSSIIGGKYGKWQCAVWSK